MVDYPCNCNNPVFSHDEGLQGIDDVRFRPYQY